ncbi:phytanoyl-CoA dioxygenase family protein [bacterium F16]|nr:phytanoyl-CoA dioxygenase family protein [bacterium F16]
MFELTQEQINTYTKNGFVKGGQLLSDSQVDELRAELDRIIAEKEATGESQALSVTNLSKTDSPVIQVVNIWMGSAAFRKVMMCDDLGKAAQQLMGSQDVRIWHDQIQYKPSQNGGVNMWHQDWPYWGILSGPTQVTAWVALDDVDEGNGCMSMVPESQAWGNQIEFLHDLDNYNAMPESFEGNPIEVVPCPVKKGEVHFHHGLTWHGSHANTSGRPRRAIAFHYMSEETCFVGSGDHTCKALVDVGDGETLTGEYFPQVWP